MEVRFLQKVLVYHIDEKDMTGKWVKRECRSEGYKILQYKDNPSAEWKDVPLVIEEERA